MNLPGEGLTSTASTAITNLLSAVVREPERDPVTALLTLALDDELQSLVAALLSEVGYKLGPEDIVSEDLDTRTVTVARNGSAQFFIISVPAWVLEQVNNASRAAVSAIGYLFQRESRLYLIARDLAAMDLAFDLMICKQWKERLSIQADFIPWNHLIAASRATGPLRLISLNRIFKFDQKAPGAPPAPQKGGGLGHPTIVPKPPEPNPMNLTLKPDDIDSIVNILSPRAADILLSKTPEEYFRDLIAAAHLPQKFRENVAGNFGGNATMGARRLVESAIVHKINSDDPRYTVLGGLLRALLNQGLSPDDTRHVVAILNSYGLIRDETVNDDIRLRYGLPKRPAKVAEGAAEDYGPDFEWRGAAEDVQLQSFFSPQEPPWLDVGFLRVAMKRSSAVCRVEIGDRRGTGFLVGATLLLTNYHVLKYNDGEDIDANARETILRFGCFNTSEQDPSTGHPFRLAPNPIVDQSPVQEHDFVLLRVEDKIEGEDANTPVPLDPSLPTQRSSLNIIHHPGGDSMKLSLSGNGISGVYADSGLLQYVTTAAEGSSGSPCFNDDWKVVGIHHAQRARSFGSIREGILIRAIYDRIQEHL